MNSYLVKIEVSRGCYQCMVIKAESQGQAFDIAYNTLKSEGSINSKCTKSIIREIK